MAKRSPTERALEECRKRGWLAGKVETRVPVANITRDLFGFLDVVALDGSRIVGLQITTHAHIADRRKKIRDHCSEAALLWLAGHGAIEIWGFREVPMSTTYKRPPGVKPRTRWELTVEEITAECFHASNSRA